MLQGDRIECNVDRPHNIKWDKVLEEYGAFYIHNPTLGVNQASMKYADGRNKLFFIYNTTVDKCKSFDGPMNSFKFVDFQTILDNGVQTDLTIGEFIFYKHRIKITDYRTLMSDFII